MDLPAPSRRQFLTAIGNLASASWLTMNWPQIALAAEHDHAAGAAVAGPGGLTTLTAEEAAVVEAMADLIIPGGDKPGAKDAKVVNFIDNALGTFWAAQLPSFREGLAEFNAGHAAHYCAAPGFAACSPSLQANWLHQVDETPFFQAVRRLTIVGLIALPKYGGNHEYLGWQLLGVENRHFWTAPFGFYDQNYAGFVPYPGTTIQTA